MRERPQPKNDMSKVDHTRANEMAANCPRCNLEGLVPVFHRDYRGERTLSDGRPARVNAYCTCAMGDYLRYRHEKDNPAVFRRTPELLNILEGHIPHWTDEDPTIPILPAPGDMTELLPWREVVTEVAAAMAIPEDELELEKKELPF